MGASDKIRWKRMVNEVRFLHNERDLVVEIIKEAGPQFHEHYLRLAAQNNLDVHELNKKHQQKLEELYREMSPKKSLTSEQDSSDSGSLAMYEGPQILEDNDYQILKDDTEIRDSFKKLFKQLALKLHPDKITGAVTIEQGMENLRLFQEAQSALSEQRYFVLLDLAERYNISQPKNYKQQVRWMKKESERLATKIKKHKDSYNYIFSECNSDEEKDMLIKRFVAHLFDIHLQ